MWVHSYLGSLSELKHEGTRGASQAFKQALSGALGAGEPKLSAPLPPHSRPPESLLRATATDLLLLFVAVTARLRRKNA